MIILERLQLFVEPRVVRLEPLQPLLDRRRQHEARSRLCLYRGLSGLRTLLIRFCRRLQWRIGARVRCKQRRESDCEERGNGRARGAHFFAGTAALSTVISSIEKQESAWMLTSCQWCCGLSRKWIL